MAEITTCMVWCEECTAENWDDVSTWKWDGHAVTRSGRLKAPGRCRSCDAELSEGDYVEAITLYHTPPDATRWMEALIAFDEENAGAGEGEA